MFWSGIRESHVVAPLLPDNLSVFSIRPQGGRLSSTGKLPFPRPPSRSIPLAIPKQKQNGHKGPFCFCAERDTGIEPVPQPWEGRVLPLY